MSKINEYRAFLKSVTSSLGYWKSYSLMQFTISLTRIMRVDKVSGRKLANRLGISAAQVSKVLRGKENITIETMAKFADALGAAVHIHVAKKGVTVQWVEAPSVTAQPKARSLELVELPPMVGDAFLSVETGAAGDKPIDVHFAAMQPMTATQTLRVN